MKRCNYERRNREENWWQHKTAARKSRVDSRACCDKASNWWLFCLVGEALRKLNRYIQSRSWRVYHPLFTRISSESEYITNTKCCIDARFSLIRRCAPYIKSQKIHAKALCIPCAVSCVIRRVRPTNSKYTKPATRIKKSSFRRTRIFWWSLLNENRTTTRYDEILKYVNDLKSKFSSMFLRHDIIFSSLVALNSSTSFKRLVFFEYIFYR